MKKLIKISYEAFTVILALTVVSLLYIEFNYSLSPSQIQTIHNIDIAILTIFAVDYFIRLFLAKNRMQFVYDNILDLIAIIPFDMTFRVARAARIIRLVKIFRLIRTGSLIASKVIIPLSILKTNSLDKVLKFTGNTILLSSFSIFIFEESMDNFGDALWWSIVTATTVGYGDISPESIGGRVIAVILMLVGIGTIGMITGTIATYFLGSKENDGSQATANNIYAINNLTKEEHDDLKIMLESRRNKEG